MGSIFTKTLRPKAELVYDMDVRVDHCWPVVPVF